jgi:hemolysin activation/secretion protein
LFSLYQRSQLFSDQDSFSAKVGGNSGALASFNYFADYVLFGKLHRRLSIRLNGGSDIEASRQIAGFTVDERQTGGSARVELELFRDLHGVQLYFYAEGARKTIELIDDADQAVSKTNLTTLDVGALYFHQTSESRHPRTVRMEPRLRLGLGASSSEPSFNVFSFRGNWHQKLPRLYELDFTGTVGIGSGDTPLFEQPSLGGAESVRGFRRDDAIGRTLAALQSEVWMPIPRLQATGETLGSYLRRNVRLAGFVDVGYLARASFSDAGIRVGPGLGARIIRWPVVIKLDWAYGFGEGVSGSGHGRFYLSITSNLPF